MNRVPDFKREEVLEEVSQTKNFTKLRAKRWALEFGLLEKIKLKICSETWRIRLINRGM